MLFESAARAAACHPRAWRLFLVAERCTLPLLARLSEGGAERTPLPPAVHAVLRERGAVELQRVLSAQRQLREIASIAQRLGTPCVVLKGGVSVRGPRALDVADLDLLVPPEQCHAFAAALDDSGYRAKAGGAGHHLPGRIMRESLPIDVHHTTEHERRPVAKEVWARVMPLPGLRGLSRLAPLDHAWHLLVHATSYHPERRGNLRDALLIGAADAELSADERSALEQQASTHPFGGVLLRVLAFARSLTRGETPVHWFERLAATQSVLHTVGSRVSVPNAVASPLARVVFCVNGGRADWAGLLASRRILGMDSGLRPAVWLRQRMPRVGLGCLVLLRLSRIALVAPPAVIVGWRAGRALARVDGAVLQEPA